VIPKSSGKRGIVLCRFTSKVDLAMPDIPDKKICFELSMKASFPVIESSPSEIFMMEVLQGGRVMKKGEPQDEPALEVACPICEAAPGERCHVQPGVIRFALHWERMQLAPEGTFLRGFENKRFPYLGAMRRAKRWENC
jgi:hypothetical protein